MKLYDHQKAALQLTKDKNHVAFYHDMGLGKTFTGSEKMKELGELINLVVCQKSKIDDWVEHFKTYYPGYIIYDMTVTTKKAKSDLEDALYRVPYGAFVSPVIFVINYDLIFRKPEIKKFRNFTLLLDESSMIKNENSKRSKFILELQPKNVILLSGTPTGGKYEELWSQMHLLGWNISKKMFFNQYVDYHFEDDEGFPLMVINGYKNEERLKRKMREHGCNFLKTEEVFDLPSQTFQKIRINTNKEYKVFRRDRIVRIEEVIPPANDFLIHELVGDTTLSKMLYERQLCGQYNKDKLEAFKDLVESTEDRLIVFYNFTEELNKMVDICSDLEREISIVNGFIKSLTNYDQCSNSITFIQYQAGAMGLNLQKANKIIYFTPTLSSELFEQSKKRIHRIGQERPCFYYELTCRNSIEEKIYATLALRRDYTEKLFQQNE